MESGVVNQTDLDITDITKVNRNKAGSHSKLLVKAIFTKIVCFKYLI